jgi:transglutaminase-like putative cysteine protease
MKRIRIVHKTEYYYNQPVTFGPHRALLRPREGHDVHIARSRLDIEPAASLQWLRDIYGNSIAVLTFANPSSKLSILSEVDVDLYYDNPIECLIEPTARCFPFQYAPEEQVELIPYDLHPWRGLARLRSHEQ